MRRVWQWLVVAVGAVLLWWGLVWVANHWLLPGLDCLANGGEACSSSALLGVVCVSVLAVLYGVWRVVRRLLGPRQ